MTVSNYSHKLTKRERELIQLLAEGKQRGEMAEALCISQSTVDWHLKNAYAKLGARRNVEAIILAAMAGYLSENPWAGGAT